MMEALGHTLDQLEGWRWINDLDWAWPVCEMIHYIGMALLIGSIGLLDFRILGIGKGLPIARLEALVPVGVIAFALNLLTGTVFVLCNPSGGPTAYLTNLAFQLKMILVLVAGINAIAFYITGISRRLETVGASDDAPVNAKVVAGVSLAAWIGVIIFGRLIMYNDTLLLFLGL
jgi:hypothetical protein